VWLGGQRIDLIRREHLLKAVQDALDGNRSPLRLASANLDHVYRFDGEADLFETDDAGQWLVLLDGMPLVWATRRRTGRPWEQLAGSDLLPALLAQCEAGGTRVGFVGGSDELRERLPAALAVRWPDLVVGLGKPRQERWIGRHSPATGARVTAAFGASTEFIAGVQQRCPDALSKVGAEWAYRLYKEPRRLAKRYLAEGPVALTKVVTRK